MKSNPLMLATPVLLFAACATAPISLPPQILPANVRRSPIIDDLEAAQRAMSTHGIAAVASRAGDLDALASIPMPTHPSVGKALTLFTNRLKPSVQESLTRSAQYRQLIDRVLDEYKLPKALAYLPVIESAYLPRLTSRAGARGIWQFMDETAREYGLRIDWWVDERADPEKSTRAAAAFLKDLYHQFNDWPLTLAAYNTGAGRVKRALATTGAQTFWELLDRTALPAETRGYVPTFFATISIAADPATFGFQLARPATSDVKRIEVEGPVSLGYLAQIAGIDEQALVSLNPSYRRGIVPPGLTAVAVPSGGAREIAAHAATAKYEDTLVSLCAFRLREGDSIRRLAAAIGTQPETLLAMNDIRDAGEGDTIYLPVRARELGALLAGEQYYAVRKGDTVFSIAKRFDLSVDELRELNQLTRAQKIHAGDRLRVSAPRALSAGGM